MSNTLFTAWVKNVYSLGMNSGVTRGETLNSYTPPLFTSQAMRVKPQLFTHLSTSFPAVLSTLISVKSYLLMGSLYPLSTVPTIKRTKE